MIPLAVVLFLNALFNAVVWPTFFRRVTADPRAKDANGKATRFLKVHAVIFAIALVLALVSLLLGIIALTGML
ncbi:SCO4848 family membrane protein [Microbacterium sp. NPDC058345]|uniref:SCO4848 family membrane protein n=1 Tax=Microbacterium sp. NPDC058345 TaxID=3346455 RepID=UPI00364C892D